MKKMKKQIVSALLATTMIGAMMTGCGNKLDGTQIAATVDDHKITLGLAHLILREQQAATEDYLAYFAETYGMDVSTLTMWDDDAGEGSTYGELEKSEVMGMICELYAFSDHAADYDVALTEEDNEKIAAAAAQFMKDNTQETIDILGVSESDVVTYLELLTIRERMYDPMVANVDRKVTEKESNQTTVTIASVSITGTERDDKGNLIPLTEEELAAKEKICKDIIAEIQKEEDIAKADISKIATKVDENVNVGTLSFTTEDKEQTVVEDVVVKAVADMEDGALCETVIKGEKVYYVVRLDAALDEEATKEKVESIIESREVEIYEDLAEEWTYETTVNIDWSVWKQVKLTDKQSFRYTETVSPEDKEK